MLDNNRYSTLLRRCSFPRHALSAFAFLAVISAQRVGAQSPAPADPGSLQLTRPQLQLLLKQYEEGGRSSNQSDEFKIRARSEAELIKRRLVEGDFQLGDQVIVNVEGEPNMPLTLDVAPGKLLVIPGLGELSLAGVLRSELREKVRAHVARFVQNPTVHTQSMIRLAVFGEVGQPGYRNIATDKPLSDAIMAAGGPGQNAKLGRAKIERGKERIWEGEVLEQAIAEGRTVDQMSLRSGDQFTIPGSGSATVLRVLAIVPTTLLAITALVTLF
jgi:protein involved in polysaccharide export with SLBB domain